MVEIQQLNFVERIPIDIINSLFIAMQ